MKNKGFKIKAKFANKAIYESMIKSNLWKLTKINDNFSSSQLKNTKIFNKNRSDARRKGVITYNFDFIG